MSIEHFKHQSYLKIKSEVSFTNSWPKLLLMVIQKGAVLSKKLWKPETLIDQLRSWTFEVSQPENCRDLEKDKMDKKWNPIKQKLV